MKCLSDETRGFKAGKEMCLEVRNDNTTSTVKVAIIQGYDGIRRVIHGPRICIMRALIWLWVAFSEFMTCFWYVHTGTLPSCQLE